jgi:hypothetical protein
VLIQVADGVLVHQSDFLQTNAVVVQGRAGVLLIDPGVRGDEMTCLANDLADAGQPVMAGFSGRAQRYADPSRPALLTRSPWPARVTVPTDGTAADRFHANPRSPLSSYDRPRGKGRAPLP